MIGFQEVLIKNSINKNELAKKLGAGYSTILYWINHNKVPVNQLNQLSKILNVSEEYLNLKVNDINTSKSRYKGFNRYKIFDDYVVVYLEKLTGEIYETIIDNEDLPRLISLDYSWHCVYKENTKSNYARSSVYYGEKGKKKCKMVYLHDVIMNKQTGQVVDHIEHDTLNNRKLNLRVTENKKNIRNRKGANKNNYTTGVRNVTYIESADEYWVQITKDGVRYKWVFPSNRFEEACKLAEEKREELFGDFAGRS